MHRRILPPTLVLIVVLSMIASFVVPVAAAPAAQGPEVTQSAIFRGVSTAVKFDVSPPLDSITPIVSKESKPFEIPERGTGLEGALGPQDADAALQTTYGPSLHPRSECQASTAPATSPTSAPPDPVGDVGPNHYVAMSNLSFQYFQQGRRFGLWPSAKQHAVGRLRRPLPNGKLRRPDRALRPVGRPLDPDPVHLRWPHVLQLRGRLHDPRPDQHVLPLRLQHRLATSRTTPSTACGRMLCTSAPVSSWERLVLFKASALTLSTAASSSPATRRPR